MQRSWYTSVRYRVQQFVRALTASISVDERCLVEQRLSIAEQRLFWAMPRYDQRHCLDVYRTLWATGCRDELLLRAAIFHDCGKVDGNGKYMPLWCYVLVTLLKQVPPLYCATAASGRGPLRPVRVYAEHAWRGSQLAAAAGSPPEVVATIRHYHDEAPEGRAALLQWADEQY